MPINWRSFANCATIAPLITKLRQIMTNVNDLQRAIRDAAEGISLSDILTRHPDLPRRTAQRWISQLVANGKISAKGEGRARRYFARQDAGHSVSVRTENSYPNYIPVSADSKDILAYIDQPMEARKPVGYQREFLETYEPNKTWYLSAPLRRQLRKMGDTRQTELPAGTYGKVILNRLLIDLSWASSHLEGNTYSRLDTRELIEHGKVPNGKAAFETQMILNHKSAVELLVENVGITGFNRYTILNLHSSLSENLLPNPADEGRVREHMVEIGKSVFRPLSIQHQINELLDLMLDKANRINDPYEQSFFVMAHLPYLQPFADVNKRTSRLAANLPLLRANLCPLTFLDVPEQAYSRAILGIYELTRTELLRDLYVWAYERSTREYLAIKQVLAEPEPLRLEYGHLIKEIVYQVVINHQQDPINVIRRELDGRIKDTGSRVNVEALIIDELRRMHEGVLARYGLRPSEYAEWRNQRGQSH